jgi:hypothetical protein
VDRISALRNVEDALRKFENGDADLLATEREVATVLRTYATEFESDEGLAAYRATGLDESGEAGGPATGIGDADGTDGGADPVGTAHDRDVEATVVVAGSRAEARERLAALFDLPADAGFEVERLG